MRRIRTPSGRLSPSSLSIPLALSLALCMALQMGIVGVVQAQPSSPEVVVQTVTEERISNRLEALGTLRANESIRLTSNVTKTVTKLNFDDGERVEQGQVLVEMTSAEELAQLDEARINAQNAERQLERVKALVDQRAASQSLLDDQRREYESALARLNAVQSRLEDLRLKAPFDGVVGLRNISVGALVSPGDLITTLNDDSRMKLDFTLPAVHMRSVEKGQTIVARSRALGEQTFEGEVFSIDNQVDPVTRSIAVRALLPNDEGLLKQGLLMTVELSTKEREALVVSEAALMARGSEQYVFVVNSVDEGDGSVYKAEQRTVKPGQRFVGYLEILEGLEPGERVITHGLQKVRSDQEVRVMAEESGGDALQDLLNQSGR